MRQKQELLECFQKSGYSFSKKQFHDVLRFADVDCSGNLDKNEFMAVCSFMNTVQKVRKFHSSFSRLSRQPSMLTDCQQLFNQYKTDTDEEEAYLPYTKLRKALAEVGYEFSNKQLRLCRAIVDKQKNGHLTYEELLNLFIYLKWNQVAFDKVDKDGSNTITLDEILSSLSSLGQTIPQDVAEKAFKKVDFDRNQHLTVGEFFEFMIEAKVDIRHLDFSDDGKPENFE